MLEMRIVIRSIYSRFDRLDHLTGDGEDRSKQRGGSVLFRTFALTILSWTEFDLQLVGPPEKLNPPRVVVDSAGRANEVVVDDIDVVPDGTIVVVGVGEDDMMMADYSSDVVYDKRKGDS